MGKSPKMVRLRCKTALLRKEGVKQRPLTGELGIEPQVRRKAFFVGQCTTAPPPETSDSKFWTSVASSGREIEKGEGRGREGLNSTRVGQDLPRPSRSRLKGGLFRKGDWW